MRRRRFLARKFEHPPVQVMFHANGPYALIGSFTEARAFETRKEAEAEATRMGEHWMVVSRAEAERLLVEAAIVR